MRKLILLTVLALGSTAAQAENGFFYLGVGAARNSLSDLSDFGLGPLSPNLDNTSWKAFLGMRPLNWLAVEADYYDLGSGSGGDAFYQTHADGKAFAVYAVSFLPIPLPMLDIYGKAGLARSKVNGESSSTYMLGTTSSVSSSGTGFAWGIGAQAHISMVGVRLEYEGFSVPNSSDARVASLSVFLNF
jgi:opacity protein-like surface antigen